VDLSLPPNFSLFNTISVRRAIEEEHHKVKKWLDTARRTKTNSRRRQNKYHNRGRRSIMKKEEEKSDDKSGINWTKIPSKATFKPFEECFTPLYLILQHRNYM